MSFDKAKGENTPFYSQLVTYNPNGYNVGFYDGTTLKYDNTNDGISNPTNCNVVTGSSPNKVTTNPCIAPLSPLVHVSGNKRQTESEIGMLQQPSVDRSWGVGGKIEFQVSDDILLRSITAYREVKTDQWDGSATAHRAPFVPNASFGRYSLSKLWEHQFSQELQIVGSLPQLDFVLGGYYFRERVQEEAATPNPLKWNADGTAITINSATGPGGWAYADWSKERGSYAYTKSLAVFGQATFTPAGFDILHLTVGGRYTHDERNGVLYVVRNVATNWVLDYSDNRFDPMVTVALDVSPEVNLYAKYSTGYRAGGANSRSSDFSAFGPESVKAYEVGAKLSLLDDHVRLNLAGYIMDREGTQVDFDYLDTSPTLPGTSTPNPNFNRHTQNTANAPDISKLRGIEVELTAKPIRELTLGVSYAYTHTDIPATPNPNPGPNFGIPTEVFVVFTPKHALSGFVDYAARIADNGTGLRFHLDANYAGPQHTFQDEATLTEKSFIMNGRIAVTDIPLTDSGASLTLALWSRNLLNEGHIYRRSNANSTATKAEDSSGAYAGQFNGALTYTGVIGDYANFNTPRTFGVEATINF